MSEHVLDWLGAYHDGELYGARRQAVEAHLSTCAECRAGLEALRGLSDRLRAAPPMPARTPPGQFVAQVQLRLAPLAARVPERARLRQLAGLWLPLGALTLWALGQAALAAGSLVWLVWWGISAQPPYGLIDLVIVYAVLTAVVAGLVWGGLAGWWAAREPEPDAPATRASLPAE